MKLTEIIASLEKLAPPSLQENYDNSGLLVGHSDMDISSALVCLDSTPQVIDEAIIKGCNLVIAHHPIIFSGLKKLNGKNYIEQAVIQAIKNDIAIYAIHTNLDNVHDGVNSTISKKLGLINTQILEPKTGLLNKLVVFVPNENSDQVRNAMFEVGAGSIGNYDQCSFNQIGNGTFRPSVDSNPYKGKIGERNSDQETRIELLVPNWALNKVLSAMTKVHPYEEVAYDIYPLANKMGTVGSGMIGMLEEPMNTIEFLKKVKIIMKADVIRHTALITKEISRVAVCGGSGSFLLKSAIAANADIFITADFKYHQFFDADSKIIVADIGHYESEQFTVQLIVDWLNAKLPTFATHFTEVNTNPVSYM